MISLVGHGHWLNAVGGKPQNCASFYYTLVSIVLKGVLQPQIYDNFMLLSVGVYILANPKYCMEMNELANTMLVSFVEHFGQLYGEEFLVYNIHGLVHLSDDVKTHGNLDQISAFPYENFLGRLKKNGLGPLQSFESGDPKIIRAGICHLQS